MRIMLASATVAQYPSGGGHWNWLLQYPFGLRDLGYHVVWLEVVRASTDHAHDVALIGAFLERTAKYGLGGRVVVALARETPLANLDEAEIHGATRKRLMEFVRETDLLWNFWYALKAPLLNHFRRRAFIDVDPGHLQVCAASFADLALDDHDAYLTVGMKMHDADCGVPSLGRKWHSFRPFAYLPLYQLSTLPDAHAPFSSITHWSWEELHFNHRVLSVSKRAAYLRYADLPSLAQRRMELAADLPSEDETIFRAKGWQIVSPERVAGSPEQYRDYIARSRAEFMCPKPIHLDLKTGWFSDRSVAYLASGRPVLAEDTGFSEKLPTGLGLIPFRDLNEAVAGVTEIDRNYAKHCRAARELAEEFFDSGECLQAMLRTCDL
jgi:hypothetical protein